MAREDVNIKVSSNVAEAIQMWKAMEEGPQAMANQMDIMSQRGKKGANDMASAFEGLIGKWASITTGIMAAKAALDIYIQAKERMNELENENTLTVDEASRRLFVQGTVTDTDEQSRIRQQVLRIGTNRATTGENAFAAATQLVSSGFSMDETVNGGGLDEFLKILNTTNASGANTNPDELAKAMVQYMTASGQDLTAENLRSNGIAIQSLFRGTNLQVGGLARFAPEAATIAQFTGQTSNEMGAAYSQFLDVTDDAKGSTAYRSGVVSLATAGADRKKTEALKQLGLDVTDVDFQGESFEQVLQRLSTAFGKVSGDQRNVLMKQLFGQDGMTFGNVMLSDQAIAEYRRRVALTKDEAGFNATLGIAESGISAEERRTTTMEQQNFFDEDRKLTTEDYNQRIAAQSKLRGDSDWTIWWRQWGYNRARNFMSDADAADFKSLGGTEGIESPVSLTPDEVRALGNDPSRLKEVQSGSARGEFYRRELERAGIDINITLRDATGNEIPQDAEVQNLNQPGGGN